MTEASPRGPNQPMNTTVRRSSCKPTQAMATGTIRMTVRASTANTTSCHSACWKAGTNIAEPTTNHTRSDSTSPVTSVNAIVGSRSGGSRLPKAMPAMKAATNPFAPTWTVPA